MNLSNRKNKAGVVVYRKGAAGSYEVLLVSARKFPGSWVFPTGTREPGESAQQTAQRECLEECGCLVEVGQQLGEVEANQRIYTYFLGGFNGWEGSREEDRQLEWVPLAKVAGRVPAVFRPVAEAAVKVLEGEDGESSG